MFGYLIFDVFHHSYDKCAFPSQENDRRMRQKARREKEHISCRLESNKTGVRFYESDKKPTNARWAQIPAVKFKSTDARWRTVPIAKCLSVKNRQKSIKNTTFLSDQTRKMGANEISSNNEYSQEPIQSRVPRALNTFFLAGLPFLTLLFISFYSLVVSGQIKYGALV